MKQSNHHLQTRAQTLLGAAAILTVSSSAFAHPEHAHWHSSFGAWQAGFIHPFMGADHMMLAIGLGMLMLRFRHHYLVLLSLIVGLSAGFALTVHGYLNTIAHAAQWIEYGILASVLWVAVALWQTKSNNNTNTNTNTKSSSRIVQIFKSTLPFAALMLSLFHGAAHGLELPPTIQSEGFFGGMLMGMGALFLLGYGLKGMLQHHTTQQPIIQKVLAIVGLIAVWLG